MPWTLYGKDHLPLGAISRGLQHRQAFTVFNEMVIRDQWLLAQRVIAPRRFCLMGVMIISHFQKAV